MRSANSAHRMCCNAYRVARAGVYVGLAAASLLLLGAWADQENAVSGTKAEEPSGDRAARLAPNYALEERFLPDQVGKLVFDLSVTPHWFSESDRFWYSYETPEGTRYYVVDPVKKTKTPLWDNAKVAAALSMVTDFPYDAQHLPVKRLKLADQDTRMRFEVEIRKEAVVPTSQKGTRAKRISRSKAKKER